MTRSDIHAPGSPLFDPQAYDLVDVYDLHHESNDHRDLNRAIETLAKEGIVQAPHSRGCGHCGQTNLRYVALLIHRAAREWIFVGQDCLAARFVDQTRASFLQLKKDAELARAKQAKKVAFLALCDENPVLAWATYADNIEIGIERGYADLQGEKVLGRDAKYLGTHPEDHRLASGTAYHTNTLRDIARKARTYGEASAKQIAFVERLLGEIEGKTADYRAKIEARRSAPAVPALAEGRQVIEGQIVTVKEETAYFGYREQTVTKVLVKLDGGQRVWGTLPSAIWNAERGARVRFTATVSPKYGEPDFGFYSRPTKAEILVPAEV